MLKILSYIDFNVINNVFGINDSRCKKQWVNIIFGFLIFAKILHFLIEPTIEGAHRYRFLHIDTILC